MEFIEINFYDYKIRMCVDNGIRMYLVSDLLPQYNKKHNTNKQFNNYLRNQEVEEVVEELANSVRSDPSLPSNGSQDDQNTGISKSIFPSNDYQNSSRQMIIRMASLTFLA